MMRKILVRAAIVAALVVAAAPSMLWGERVIWRLARIGRRVISLGVSSRWRRSAHKHGVRSFAAESSITRQLLPADWAFIVQKIYFI